MPDGVGVYEGAVTEQQATAGVSQGGQEQR